MKKLNITFLLTLLMIMVGAKAFAYDAYIDGIYYNFSGTNASVTYYTSGYYNRDAYTGNVVIPETVTYNGNTYSVTSIGGSAFSGCTKMTSVTIPNSVTWIGGSAFQGCTKMTSVTIPNSVTSIGYGAFYGTALYNNAANGVFYIDKWICGYKGDKPTGDLMLTDDSRGIGEGAFSECSGLTSVTIPNSVTSIGGSAFKNCSGLTSVTMGKSVTYIGSNAFSGCSSLACIEFHCKEIGGWFSNLKNIKEVIIGDDVMSIGSEAFRNCTGLTSVTIGNSVTSIGDWAFECCSGLTSVTIGNSVTSIGDWAFECCSGLTSVTIGNSVTSIGKGTFYECSGLTSVTIPNSVTSIGSSAFWQCSGLTSVAIGNSVTSIGDRAFYGCSGLISVTIGNSVTSIGSDAFSGCSSLMSVNVPVIDLSAFCNNQIVNLIREHIGKPVHLINEEGNEIKDLVIPDDVTSIGESAFRRCSGLTSVTIPNSVTSIGSYAFSGCSSLQSVVVGNGVTNIPNYAFSTGTNIKSFTVGAGVLSIDSYAFGGNYNNYCPIKTIWLTNTPPQGYNGAAGMVNYVANDQYSSISNKKVYPFLSSMFEADGIKYVPVSPSERTCDAIDCVYSDTVTSVRLSDKVTFKGVEMKLQEMGQYLFYGNGFLQHIDLALEDDLQRAIPVHTFEECSNIEELIIPDNVTDIGDNALSGCVELVNVKLGKSVSSIGESALSGCAKVASITIPQSVNSIGNNAFRGCKELKDVVITDRTEVLGLGYNYYNYNLTPLFADCPLDSVYIGGNINYNTSSNYGYSPFYRNTSLRTVVITDKETEISENEFYGCTNLQDVKIGDGVESFGDWAFSGCSSLKHFAFGMSVERIGKEAFSDCTAMESIASRSPEPPVCGSQALDDINKWECVLTVPAGNKAAYMAADQWKEFFFVEDGEAVNKFVTISIEKSEGGKVLVNDKEETEVSLKRGSDVTLKFVADEGHSLAQVTVNGEDITGQVTNGSYTLKEVFADVTVKVTFSVNSYKLIYLVDGEEYKILDVDYGTVITPEESPEKEGYTFSGWSEIPATMPAHDVTVTGTFSINSYTLTYLLDGEEYKKMEVVYGSAITPEAAPAKEGYTFNGWSEIPATMPAHDVTVTGTMSPNLYQLVYLVDGLEYKTVDVPFGSAITPEPEPEKEGYTFSGWIGLPETMPARLVIVTGIFSINSYTLTYMIDEEVYKQTVYEYGASITPEPQPEGDYISFEWVGVPETMPAHDVTVTAVYETGIAEIILMTQQGQVRIYAPNGKKLDKPQKGLNIVVMQDGTIKKIVVK